MRSPTKTKNIPQRAEDLSARGRGSLYTTGEMLQALAVYRNTFGEYPKTETSALWREDARYNMYNHKLTLPCPKSYTRRFGGIHAACVAADYWFPTGSPVLLEDLGKHHDHNSLINGLAMVLLAVGNGPVWGNGSNWHPRLAAAEEKIGVRLAAATTYAIRYESIPKAVDLALEVARTFKLDDPESFGHVDLDNFSKRGEAGVLKMLADYYEKVGNWPKSGGFTSGGWSKKTGDNMKIHNLSLPAVRTIAANFDTLHNGFAQASLKVLGVEPNTADFGKMYSEKQLLDALRRIARSIGSDAVLSQGENQWNGLAVSTAQRLEIRLPTPNTYIRRFGGIDVAVRLATKKKA